MTAIDDTTARIKAFDLRLSEAIAKFKTSTGVQTMTITKNASDDNAAAIADAPFTLCADAIVERINEATGETAYEVEKDGKVIYSTLSRALAFAFIAGVNTRNEVSGGQGGADAAKKIGGENTPSRGAQSGGDAQSGDGRNPRNKSGEPSKPTPASLDSAKPEVDTTRPRTPIEAEPRKRAVL